MKVIYLLKDCGGHIQEFENYYFVNTDSLTKAECGVAMTSTAYVELNLLLTHFNFTIYTLNTNLYFNRFNKLQCLDDPLRMK